MAHSEWKVHSFEQAKWCIERSAGRAKCSAYRNYSTDEGSDCAGNQHWCSCQATAGTIVIKFNLQLLSNHIM